MVRRKSGGGVNEQVEVIGHNLHFFNLDLKFFCLLMQKLFEPNFNISLQHLAAVFWAPDDVIADVVDC
jgi:hypothetical protein